MATAGEVVVRVRAEDDASRIVAKIKDSLKQFGDQARKSSEEAGESFKDVKEKLSALSGSLFSLKGILGSLFVGFSVERFISGIVEAGSEVEGYRAQLEALMGSADKANQALQDLIEYARTTPFETKNVVQAAVQLQAFGVNAHDLIPTLGDLAAAFNRDITEAVYAMTAAFTGQSEVLRRWGIDMRMKGNEITFIWRDSMNRVREITVQRSNEIIAQTLQMIFNEKYAGAIDRFKGTWKGLVMTLKSQWWEFRKAIAESGFLDTLKQKLQEIVQRINEMMETGELEAKAQEISKAFSDIASTAMNVAKALWNFRAAFVALMGVLVVGKVAAAVAAVADAISVLSAAASAAVPALSALAAPLSAIGAAIAVVKGGWDAIQDAFDVKQFQDAGQGILVMDKALADMYERLQYNHEAVLVSKDELTKYRRELERLAASHGKVLKVLQLGPEAYQLEFVWQEQVEQQAQQTAQGLDSLVGGFSKTQQSASLAIPGLQQVKATLQSVGTVIPQQQPAWNELGLSIQQVNIDVENAISVWDRLAFHMMQVPSLGEEIAQSFTNLTQNLGEALGESLDYSMFEQGYQEDVEFWQSLIEQQETTIEELQQKKMEAIMKGDEATAESIQKQIEEHQRLKEEYEQNLDELEQKHNSVFAQIWRSFRREVITNITKSLTRQLMPSFAGLFSFVGETFSLLSSAVSESLGDIVSGLGNVVSFVGGAILKILAQGAAWIANAAAAAVSWLVETLGPYAIAAIPAALAGIYALWGNIKSTLGFAEGGLVPGTGSGDIVPAFLTPGEFVLRKEVVQTIGVGTLEALNRNPSALNRQVIIQSPQISVIVHANMNEMSARELGQEIATSVGEALKNEIRMGITRLEELNAF